MANVSALVKKLVEEACNENVGGWYNAYLDEGVDGIKGLDETLVGLVDTIYSELRAYRTSKETTALNLAGKLNVKLAILEYLKPDVEGGDIAELREACGIWKGTYDEALKVITDSATKKVAKGNYTPPASCSDIIKALWEELRSLGGDCIVVENEPIQRMRLVMAIKACKANKPVVND